MFQMQVNVTDNTSASAVFLNIWVELQFCVGLLKNVMNLLTTNYNYFRKCLLYDITCSNNAVMLA
jgi:hypothetical protein